MDNASDIVILYVEDDEVVRDISSELLKEMVGNVYVAKDGAEGLEMFYKYNPDIIISDLAMPKMNGMEMINEIRNENSKVQIVVTTMYDDLDIIANLIEKGINYFVKKPINYSKFFETLEKCIEATEINKNGIFFETLIENSNDIVYSLGLSGKIKYVSPNVRNVLGYNDNDMENRTFLKYIHQEDYDMVSNVLNNIVSGDISKNIIEFRMRNAYGNYPWINSTIYPVFENEKLKYIAGIARDITENKRKDSLLRERDELWSFAIDGLGDAVWDVNVKEMTLKFSRNFMAMLGYKTTNDNSSFDNMRQYMHPDDFPKVLEEQRRFYNSIDMNYKSEYRMLCKNGEYKWLLSRGVVVRWDEDGNPERIIGTHIDITERKRLEEELEKAINNEKLANKAKSEFLASMSHEIRTPMNSVTGFLEILETLDIGERAQKYVQEAKKASDNLLYIINEILDISKIEANKLEFEEIKINIIEIVESAVSIFAQKAQEKNVKIEGFINKNVPSYVMGDSTRLTQILINLIGNAVKFTSEGKVYVECNCKRMDSEKIILEFIIRDNGIGITEEEQKRIFQPFSQANESTVRKYGGTGLGLKISKNLIELMNGNISIKSVYGKGTEVLFDVNLKCCKMDIEKNKKIGGNIVVISSEENDITLEYFKRFGTTVTNFSKGEEAILFIRNSLLQNNKVDVIVLEDEIEDMKKREFAKYIKSDSEFCKIPIIVLHDMVDNEILSENKIYDYFISRPIHLEEINTTLSEILGNCEKQKEDIKIIEFAKKANKNIGKVLIVDDVRANQILVSEILKKAGIKYEIAENGKEALEKYKNDIFEIILMDWWMPDLTGLEVTKEIRKIEKEGNHTVIIAMTANSMSGDKEKCIEAGMDDYISKPFSINKLTNIVNKWFDIEEKKNIKQGILNQNSEHSIFESIDEIVNRISDEIGLDLNLAEEIFNDFKKSLGSVIEEFNKFFELHDLLLVGKMAHKFKGMCLNMCLRELVDLCVLIEASAKANNFEESKIYYSKLKKILNRF